MKPEIVTAESAGFCYGVKRAVGLVESLLDQGERVCTLGPIIHNTAMVERLAARGARCVASIDEVEPDETLVLRSHGVEASIMERLVREKRKFCDGTCPHVAKIHRIVINESRKGGTIIVAADCTHPEAIGVCSRCDTAYCVRDAGELAVLVEAHPELRDKPVALVAQTTFSEPVYLSIKAEAARLCGNLKIFDTICDATDKRRAEAARIAATVDAMVVVGSRHSSNSRELAAVCAEHCPTYLVDTAGELPIGALAGCRRIGVTTGASAPVFIMKEVQLTMNEELQGTMVPEEQAETVAAEAVENVEEVKAPVEETKAPVDPRAAEDLIFTEAIEGTIKSVYNGEKVTATVVRISPNEIAVDIGTKHAGFVPLDELTDDPNAKAEDLVKIGDQLELVAVRVNDVEGTVMLSKKRFDAAAGFEKIMGAVDTEEVLDGKVVEVVKGGMLVMSNGVRVFIPASQSTVPKEGDLNTMMGAEVKFKILEVNRGRKRAVGSIRAAVRDMKRAAGEAFWNQVKIGDVYKGEVKSITSYGAFVDIGGVDGMVHISELSWSRIKHPSEVVKVGDKIEVYVKDLDYENHKISLGYKKTEDNPWEVFKRDFPVGTVCKVTIVSLTTFGAFARILPGIDGLIHISQIARERIAKPSDVLNVGDVVDVKITEADLEKHRISLSIRALLEDAAEPVAEEPAPQDEEVVMSFGPDDDAK